MTDLIARLEAAEAGSRELDAEILKRVCPEKWQTYIKIGERIFVEKAGMKALGRVKTSAGPEREVLRYCPFFTSSLDAITALIGEKLPGWTTDVHMADASPCTYPVHWRVESVRFDDCTAGIYYQHPKIEERELGEGCGKTPALALCAALLRAIQEGADG